jgi:hypothetical protein
MTPLEKVVHTEIVACVMVRMRNMPALADVPDVANAFVAELRDHGLGDGDADRVRQSFRACRRSDPWFPTIANIIASLPKKIHTEVKKLPRPEMSPEAKALGEKAFAEMRKVVS